MRKLVLLNYVRAEFRAHVAAEAHGMRWAGVPVVMPARGRHKGVASAIPSVARPARTRRGASYSVDFRWRVYGGLGVDPCKEGPK